MRVFVAGGSGAIGRRLVPQLVERGHEVTASTRSADRYDELRALGAEPIVMDGLDAGSVAHSIAQAAPEVVVHQMSALGGGTDLRHCRSLASDGREWECYLGQKAVDEQIIGPSLLGAYAPSPGVG